MDNQIDETPRYIRVSRLIQHLSDIIRISEKDVEVNDIVQDSRQVKRGSLFVAIQGETTDGHEYIQDAVQRGANAIVGTRPISDLKVPYVQVTNSQRDFAQLAAAFYGFPARKLTVIGITGTDGKTTTANMIFKILNAAGIQAGMISTVSATIGEDELDTGFHVTTPEASVIQRYLARMVVAGLTHIILEVTSHGLAQHRVDACDFDFGVVTNITHDHLDYHGSFGDYQAAKGMLFTSLSQSQNKPFILERGAVLNRDDDSFSYLHQLTDVKCINYGINREADLFPSSLHFEPERTKFIINGTDLHNRKFQFPIEYSLPGEFNVYNALAAVALTHSFLGIAVDSIQKGFSSLNIIPGRMEKIELGQGFITIIDFAHTPNALKQSLETARTFTSRRVIAVFGSAGLRDREKRRLMSQTSARLADITILTAEDPRTESLQDILTEMSAGILAEGGIENQTFWRIPDRRQAIRFAVRIAQPGDLVIVCGKGHEQSMCFGNIEYPWDDRAAMRAALAEQLGLDVPEMPFLPT